MFSTDGAKVVADFEVYQAQRPLQVGYAVYDEQNKYIFSYSYNAVDGTTGVFLDGKLPGGLKIDITEPSPEVPEVRLGLSMNEEGEEPVTGTYKLLMWSAGGGSRHVHALRGDQGSSCLGVATGHDTFIYTARDFRGTLTMKAGAGGNAAARANYNTSLKLKAKGTLVGAYFSLAAAVDEMSVDRPSGSQSCPCYFGNFLPDSRTPFGPGLYTFHDSGAGVAGSESEIVLAGADAHLVGFDASGHGCGGSVP
ncbi:MAG: hypothetical protein ACRDH9_09535 [Actinomycetota bacterium]